MKKIILLTVALSSMALANNFFNPVPPGASNLPSFGNNVGSNNLPAGAGVLPSFDNTQGSNNVPPGASQLPSYDNNQGSNINHNLGIYDPIDESILSSSQRAEIRRIQFSIREKENLIFRYLNYKTPDWRRIDILYKEIGSLQATLASRYLRIKYDYIQKNIPKL